MLERPGTGLVGRARIVALGVVAASVAFVVLPSSALGSALVKLSGSLSGGRLPGRGAGVSVVQAMNLGDGTIAATHFLDRRGRFSLEVAPGPYALLAGSVFFEHGVPTIKLVGAVRARARKPRELPLSLKPAHSHTTRMGVGAVTAAATDPALARRVGVLTFTGAARYQNAGLTDMVVTDLVPLDEGPPCAFAVIEMQRRDEIIREIKLQQTQFFDPTTRVTPGRLLQPNIVVRGSLVPAGAGAVSYVLSVVNTRNGKVKGTVTGTIAPEDWLTASGGIARRLVDIICQPDDLYFRIVGYTRTERSRTDHGQRTVTDTLSGGPGPVVTVPECTDLLGCATDFESDATVTTIANGHLTGPPDSGCPGGSFTYPPQTLQNPAQLDITYDPDWVQPATATEAMIPSVGDVTSDICGANDSGDPQTVTASVSADDLLSGNPVTFTFSGSGSAPSTIGDHAGIPITWSVSESVTVERVQLNGSHL